MPFRRAGRKRGVCAALAGSGIENPDFLGGGSDPIWSREGKELFYRNGDKMMVVAVTTQPTFRASKPQLLWTGHYSRGMSSSCGPPGTTEANYDVTSNGQQFLMIKDLDADAVSTRIVVVLNFAEELKRLAQEKR